MIRKRLCILIAILGLALSVQAQNLLKPEWSFKTGDDMAWAAPGFDDSDWKGIQAGNAWENQGYDNYDGFAWYRQRVFIPDTLKKQAEENRGFILYLGKIDNADVTYWNGQVIGESGSMPPDYQSGYDVLRAYSIPADKVKWGEVNTIAVRVYDGNRGGGIISQPISLSVKGLEELVVIKPVMEREDHLILKDGPAQINLLVKNNQKKILLGKLEITGKSDFGEVILESEYEIKLRAGKTKTVLLDLGVLKPGFYNFSALLKGESDVKNRNFALGVKPEEVVSPLDRPDVFDNYWMRARRELDAVDPQFKLIRQDSLCTDTHEHFLLEMRSLGNVLIRGWYIRPVKERVYPAILHVPSFYSTMGPGSVSPVDNFVVLGINIRGQGYSQDALPIYPGYLEHHVTDKEQYIYRGAYMDCVRAVDFLYSRDEVDTSRVVVEGGSQGGALCFATAALDNKRIDLCVPNCPFLSDFRDYFKLAEWPANVFLDYFNKHPEIPEDEVYKTLSYIDIKNLAPWIKAPVLMSVGLMDLTCPPHINFAAYNQLTAHKKYLVYPYSGHGLPSTYSQVKYDYIRKEFKIP